MNDLNPSNFHDYDMIWYSVRTHAIPFLTELPSKNNSFGCMDFDK